MQDTPDYEPQTNLSLKQLHHELSELFNINARRIAAAFPAERHEDAEIYYLKGRRLMDEYNQAARAQNSFGATVGYGLLKGAGYALMGVGAALWLVLSILAGGLIPLPGDLSEGEKRSLKKDSTYGADYDRLRRNFAEDVQASLAEKKNAAKKPKGYDL